MADPLSPLPMKSNTPNADATSVVAREKDPVCGMMVDPQKAAKRVEYSGKNYYFCSVRCGERFAANPEKFLSAKEPAVMQEAAFIASTVPSMAELHAAPRARELGKAKNSSAAEKIRYTCPMDPEIVQFGPGVCPKCGMALEPMDVVAGEAKGDPEYDSMRRRFWVAVVLSVPLLVAAMSADLGTMLGLDIHWHFSDGMLNWLECALATPVVLWCSWP